MRLDALKIFLIVLFVAGCKPAERIVSEQKVTEVSNNKIEKVKIPEQRHVFGIEQICDTAEIVIDNIVYKVPPKAKEFDYGFMIDSLEGIITMKDNNFSVDINQKERIISEKRDSISIYEKEVSELKETVKRRLAFKWVALFIGIIVLFIVFPSIPRFINRTVKKILMPLIP